MKEATKIAAQTLAAYLQPVEGYDAKALEAGILALIDAIVQEAKED